MKMFMLASALVLSSHVFADSVQITNGGKTVTLTGTLNSTAAEVTNAVNEAHSKGLVGDNGEDLFTKVSEREGTRRFLSLTSKNVLVSESSGFAVIYKLQLKAKKNEITVDNGARFVTIKGEAAKVLFAVLQLTSRNTGAPGVGRFASENGKLSCSKVVYPGAKPSCVVKF